MLIGNKRKEYIMALRPIFEVYDKPPYFNRRNTDFTFFSGFAIEQKKKSARSRCEGLRALIKDSNAYCFR